MREITIGRTTNIGNYESIRIDQTYTRNEGPPESEADFVQRATIQFKIYCREILEALS